MTRVEAASSVTARSTDHFGCFIQSDTTEVEFVGTVGGCRSMRSARNQLCLCSSRVHERLWSFIMSHRCTSDEVEGSGNAKVRLADRYFGARCDRFRDIPSGAPRRRPPSSSTGLFSNSRSMSSLPPRKFHARKKIRRFAPRDQSAPAHPKIGSKASRVRVTVTSASAM